LREQDQDAVAGGDGGDAIDAINEPASRDAIDCGRGSDRMLVDDKDITKNCQSKFTSGPKFVRYIRDEGYFVPLHSL
jgi:hypothetical protein